MCDVRCEVFRAARPLDRRARDGRIFIYRTALLGAAVQPEVKVNAQVVGRAVPNGFFYVDRAAGPYSINTTTEVDRSLSLTLDKGQRDTCGSRSAWAFSWATCIRSSSSPTADFPAELGGHFIERCVGSCHGRLHGGKNPSPCTRTSVPRAA